MSVDVLISIVGDIARIQVDLLDSVVLRNLCGRRRAFGVSLFDGRFLARVLTRRSFLRGSRPVEWGCKVESFSADFSGSAGADCSSPCRGEHLFKLLERRGVGWCVGRGYVCCRSVEISAAASVKRSLHVIRVCESRAPHVSGPETNNRKGTRRVRNERRRLRNSPQPNIDRFAWSPLDSNRASSEVVKTQSPFDSRPRYEASYLENRIPATITPRKSSGSRIHDKLISSSRFSP
ncbi:hypothetical protein F2Q68_00034218 [Brassica cretica]|uniref:Uncharacterized protein n=1 Tax=Brassica cretica TaxID=69181 RepID=A0A8S9H7I0_BRACR|nr:hypothetical protein F2Q68_00034218 [Brassica cretica]